MQGLFVDLSNEIADLEREVELLSKSLEIASQSVDDPAWKWLVVQGLASGVEKIYTGCERVMAMIAISCDKSKIDRNDGWHHLLLKRMAHPYPGVRERIISDETYGMLDRLRSFRHRERNSYGSTLDSEIVTQRVHDAIKAFSEFKTDLAEFISNYSNLDQSR